MRFESFFHSGPVDVLVELSLSLSLPMCSSITHHHLGKGSDRQTIIRICWIRRRNRVEIEGAMTADKIVLVFLW